METISSLLNSLDRPLSWILLVLMIMMYVNQTGMAKDMSQINHKLDNHITDTNKKIEKLSDRFDKMSDRFDRQNDQFVRLYEILIKDKQ